MLKKATRTALSLCPKIALAPCLVATAWLFALGASAQAATSWNATTGNWSTGGNWSSTTEPGSGTTAYVNNGGTVTIDMAGEVADRLEVGNTATGSGAITQTAGELTVSGKLLGIGFNATGATGTYTISGDAELNVNGNFNGSGLYIGFKGGKGTFNVKGGATKVANDVYIGYTGGDGLLEQTGGDVTVGDNMFVGSNDSLAKGVVKQSSGTMTVKDRLFVGYVKGTGTYTLSGDAKLNTTVAAYIGDNLADGTFTISGDAVLNVGGSGAQSLYVGDRGGKGTFNVEGGTTTLGKDLNVGRGRNGNTGSTGLLTQTAGSVTVNRDAYVGLSHSAAKGEIDLSGGTMTVKQNMFVGREYGTGEVNVSDAGVLDIQGKLAFGTRHGGTGTLAVSGGSASVAKGIILAEDTLNSDTKSSTGTLKISGGRVDVTGSDSNGFGINFLNDANGTREAKVLLSGGVLDMHNGVIGTKASSDGDDTLEFLFTGGTLKNVRTFDVGIDLDQKAGTLSPGASPGITDIGATMGSADYLLGDTWTDTPADGSAGTTAADGANGFDAFLDIEIAGVGGVPGTDYDQVNVLDGKAVISLDAQINLVLDDLDLDTLRYGDTFDILTATEGIDISAFNDDPSGLFGDSLPSYFEASLIGGPGANGQTLQLFATIPEPASVAIWSLIGLGLAGFGIYRRRRVK